MTSDGAADKHVNLTGGAADLAGDGHVMLDGGVGIESSDELGDIVLEHPPQLRADWCELVVGVAVHGLIVPCRAPRILARGLRTLGPDKTLGCLCARHATRSTFTD